MNTPLDNRISTTAFGTFPLNTVVAVDSQFSFGDGLGSGIIIAPNHVLTVGHNAYSLSNKALVVNIRTTTSANQPSLKSRVIGAGVGDPGANVTIPPYFPKSYSTTGATGDDIALFRTSDAPINAADTIGLLAFVNPDTAKGLSIITAGYPAVSPLYNGTTLVISPGTGIGTIRSTSNNGTFNYTENVDTEGGQSGSGVWHILDGDAAPRVLGVHAYGFGAPFKSSFLSLGGDQNGGTLLTTMYTPKLLIKFKQIRV